MSITHCTKPDEVWRDIPGWSRLYQVSDYGRVRSKTRTVVQLNRHSVLYRHTYKGKILKVHRAGLGYWFAGLSRNGATEAHYIHRLVLLTFVGKCPKGMECRHLDGDKDNNHVTNLEWSTHTVNEMDKRKHGTSLFGPRNHQSKLSYKKAALIRKMYATGKYTQKEISRLFAVQPGQISAVVRGKRWVRECL